MNKIWLADQELGSAGQAFFRTEDRKQDVSDWTRLRNRWEYSHLARGLLATTALMLIAVAIANNGAG